MRRVLGLGPLDVPDGYSVGGFLRVVGHLQRYRSGAAGAGGRMFLRSRGAQIHGAARSAEVRNSAGLGLPVPPKRSKAQASFRSSGRVLPAWGRS
jgi:hypothetical protein